MRLSVVMPARDEAGSVAATLSELTAQLDAAEIDFEILVVDDASTDGTVEVVERAASRDGRIRCVRSPYAAGYGFAVRAGLERFEGDAVAIVMADGSDSPADVVRYHALLEEGHDCVFGSRFLPGSRVRDYPAFKLVINRLANWGVQLLFGIRLNDTTNAFKAYRREVIDSVQPLLSNHFNLTVELPLKAIVRGYGYATVPISWSNREAGRSKLALKEMGSRYLFIVAYVFLERHLTRGDYVRPGAAPGRTGSRFRRRSRQPAR